MGREMDAKTKAKLRRVMDAAEEKRGQEVIDTQISTAGYKKLRKKAAFKGELECVLYDGRYICQRWHGDTGTYHYHMYDTLAPEVLEEIILTSRSGVNEARQNDMKLEPVQEWEQDGRPNPLDQYVTDKTMHRNENDHIDYYDGSWADTIALREMGMGGTCYTGMDYPDVDLEGLPLVPEVGYDSRGHFDERTMFLLKRIGTKLYETELDEEQQEDYRLIFCSGLTLTQMAEIKGCTVQAISNRKRWFTKKFAAEFEKLGYPVSGKKKVQKTYRENAIGIQKAMEKQYLQEEAADAVREA